MELLNVVDGQFRGLSIPTDIAVDLQAHYPDKWPYSISDALSNHQSHLASSLSTNRS